MNMMNKCAKFQKDSPSGKKVKFNLARAVELSETAVLCTTLCRNLMHASEQLWWHIWPTFSFEFFFMKFSQRMPLYVFYTMVLKSQKWPKTQIKGGGPALSSRFLDVYHGAWRMQRATSVWILSRWRAASSRMEPCQRGLAYSIVGRT